MLFPACAGEFVMVLMKDPIYRQLHRALRDLARGRGYHAGARFLTERHVADRFEVSRATANKAIAALVSEGVLEYRKGIGTFVGAALEKPLDYDLRSLVSFTDQARAVGRKPGTKVLRFERIELGQVPAEARAALGNVKVGVGHAKAGVGVAEGDVFFFERLRLADEVPVIFERRWIPVAACPRLGERGVRGSLYEAFESRYGLAIAGAEQTIRAEQAGVVVAEVLGVRRSSPVLVVRATGYLESGQVLWYEQTTYRADAYEFHTRLGPVRSSAAGRLQNAPTAEVVE
jgi:GntR family transcriptional regulator